MKFILLVHLWADQFMVQYRIQILVHQLPFKGKNSMKNWSKIIFYRRIYWICFTLFLPYVLIVNKFSNSEAITIIFALIYIMSVGRFLKNKLYKEKCPHCGKLFFPAWGDLFFTKCSSCGAKVGS